MFWILLIGIIIVSCVLKEEDSSGSSSDKHSSTVTSKTRATKTLNVPYPYSAIKRMEDTGIHLGDRNQKTKFLLNWKKGN